MDGSQLPSRPEQDEIAHIYQLLDGAMQQLGAASYLLNRQDPRRSGPGLLAIEILDQSGTPLKVGAAGGETVVQNRSGETIVLSQGSAISGTLTVRIPDGQDAAIAKVKPALSTRLVRYTQTDPCSDPTTYVIGTLCISVLVTEVLDDGTPGPGDAVAAWPGRITVGSGAGGLSLKLTA